MKVLVTGATGFIGTAVVRALLQTGTQVRVLIRHSSNVANLEGLQVEPAYGDLLDLPSLQQAVTGCRQLYHVAALYALWNQDPSLFYQVNVQGTAQLLKAAGDAGMERIVYTSTIGAIGLPKDGGLGTEETPLHPVQLAGHYKRSKYLAEKEVIRLVETGLPIVIVNPTAPVGERDVKPTPTGQIIVDFMQGKMWAYLETGMNLVDVDDVAVGHLRAMERGRIGERYILGHQNLTFYEICHILSRLTGIRVPRLKLPWQAVLPLAHANQWVADFITHRSPRIPLEGVRMAKYRMHYDCSKAIRELDLPQSSVEKALEKAVQWFRKHGYA